VKPAPRRIGAAVSLGGVVSALALVALMGGLGYGGYAVLQDIQRVGVAPLPDAPAVVADAPVIPDPDTVFAAQPSRPSASAYAQDGVMFAFAPPETLATPAPARRDGPIAAIDPDTTGLIASSYDPAPVIEAAGVTAALPVEAVPGDVLETGEVMNLANAPFGVAADIASAAEDQAIDAGPPTLAVVASDRAWVRVRGAEREVLFEGIMDPGDRYDLPIESAGATLRAGNAGGVFIDLGGSRFGPLGKSGQVVKRIVLDAETVRASFPVATENAGQDTAAIGSTVAGLSD
ncbi:MAG: RodZ domain-containing protein, partial [Pseudomonadota bacterium]